MLFNEYESIDIKKKNFVINLKKTSGIILTVVFSILLLYLIINWKLFGRTNNGGRTIYIYLFFALIAELFYTYLRYMIRDSNDINKVLNHNKIVYAIIYIAVISFTCSNIIEIIFNKFYFDNLSIKYILYSAIITMNVFSILFFVFGSLKTAILVGILGYAIFAIAEFFVYQFRGVPMQINDLYDIGTAVNVMFNYSYNISSNFCVGVGTLLCICINTIVNKDITIKCPISKRILYSMSGLIVSITTAILLLNNSMWSKLQISIDGNRPGDSFKKYGVQLSFIEGVKNYKIDKPKGYESSLFTKLQTTYDSEINDKGSIPKPNIIVIMNEMFADCGNLIYLDISDTHNFKELVLPNYYSLNGNVEKGKCMVSTIGGGTGKTEYEFLTSNSMLFLGSDYSPYVTLGKRLKYAAPHQLKQLGYETYAIHPFIASNYNRKVTYEAMGFDYFLDRDAFVEPEMIRSFVSDRSCYNKIFDITEAEEKPAFIFCVTIQNHSPYNDESFDSSRILDTDDYPEAQQYCNLLEISDTAISSLIDYYSNCDEDTVIIFFGDHFPSFSDNFWDYMLEDGSWKEDFQLKQQFYTTPYFIWSNSEKFDMGGVLIILLVRTIYCLIH